MAKNFTGKKSRKFRNTTITGKTALQRIKLVKGGHTTVEEMHSRKGRRFSPECVGRGRKRDPRKSELEKEKIESGSPERGGTMGKEQPKTYFQKRRGFRFDPGRTLGVGKVYNPVWASLPEKGTTEGVTQTKTQRGPEDLSNRGGIEEKNCFQKEGNLRGVKL